LNQNRTKPADFVVNLNIIKLHEVYEKVNLIPKNKTKKTWEFVKFVNIITKVYKL
jgi:hypothetical protein